MSWTETVTNMNGDRVQAIQVLNGVERRIADAQDQLSRVESKVDSAIKATEQSLVQAVHGVEDRLTQKLDALGPVESGLIDLDAIAAKVADLIAARLAS